MDHGQILTTSATVIAKRRESYGSPTDCFDRAAAIASAMLNKPIWPYEIAMIFHAMKLARIAQSPKNMDHYVDGVSYLSFAGEFIDAEKEHPRRDTKAFAPDLGRAVATVDTIGGRPVVPLRGDPKPNGPGV